MIPWRTSLATRVDISRARPAAIADQNIPSEERRRKARRAAKPIVSGVYPNTVVLSGKFASVGAAKLVTCIVRLERDAWRVTWISDEPTPRDFKAGRLNETIDRATREISAMYAGTRAATETELQFAIYPFSDHPSTILEVERHPDGFAVSNPAGTGLAAQGGSLESLVEHASASLPNHQDAMFSWVVPMTGIAP